MSIAALILTAAPEGLKPDGAAMLKIDGRESIVRAMELFTNRDAIIQTIVVISKAEAEEVKRKIGSHLMFMGIKLVQSGNTWIEQISDAKNALLPEVKHVLVHDGARPAVPYTDLESLIEASSKHPAVCLAQPIRGQIVDVDVIPGVGKPETKKVAVVQSPAIYDRATYDAIVETKKLPETVQLIEGSILNVRCGITDPALVKAMIGLLPKPKMKQQSSPFEEAQW